MGKKEPVSTPEQVGKLFRIGKLRTSGAPLGKPDAFDDVMRRSLDRAPQRQRPQREPPDEA